jgi:hypothetical protein
MIIGVSGSDIDLQHSSVRVERSRDTHKARASDGPLDCARGERAFEVGARIMEWLPLIGVLVAAFVAWKLLTGIIKLAVIGLIIAGGAWFMLGGLG